MTRICRLCLKQGPGHDYVSLETSTKNQFNVKEDLLMCIPDIDLKAIIDPVVCPGCITNLNTTITFIYSCLETEHYIEELSKTRILNAKIDISDVQRYADSVSHVNSEPNPETETDHHEVALEGFNHDYGPMLKQEGDEKTVDKETEVTENEPQHESMEIMMEEELQSESVEVTTEEEPQPESTEEEPKPESMEEEPQTKSTELTTETKPRPDSTKVSHVRYPPPKRYQCDTCGYVCRYRSNLTNHYRSHTNEKPYVCEVCGWRAKTKTNMNRHREIHTDKKRFQCTYCDYKCRQKVVLDAHILRHTGQKPHACPDCAYRSRTKRDLTRHMAKHTGRTPYKCEECDTTFRVKWKYVLHNIKAHLKPDDATDEQYTISLSEEDAPEVVIYEVLSE